VESVCGVILRSPFAESGLRSQFAESVCGVGLRSAVCVGRLRDTDCNVQNNFAGGKTSFAACKTRALSLVSDTRPRGAGAFQVFFSWISRQGRDTHPRIPKVNDKLPGKGLLCSDAVHVKP
jgi:hypothetical protein